MLFVSKIGVLFDFGEKTYFCIVGCIVVMDLILGLYLPQIDTSSHP